jgi:hypothetical protein
MKIVEHDHLDCPDDNTVIWRYMDLAQFLDVLVQEQIYFPNMNILSDKYEGTIPKNIIEQKRAEFEHQGLTGRDLEEEMANFHYFTHPMPELSLVNCWSMERLESYALWKIYLKGSSSGVAIRSTVGALKRALENGGDEFSEEIFFGKVRYGKQGDPNNTSRFHLLTQKMPYYSYEKELRLMIFRYPLSEGGVTCKSDGPGRYVKIDVSNLIDRVYVSPFAAGWFYKTIEQTIEKIAPDLKSKIYASRVQDS